MRTAPPPGGKLWKLYEGLIGTHTHPATGIDSIGLNCMLRGAAIVGIIINCTHTVPALCSAFAAAPAVRCVV